MCIFESDTVKSDCPIIQENHGIFKDLIQTVGQILFVLERFKKALKMKKKTKRSSENDQFTDHFQSFFIYLFFRPHNPKSERNSHKSTNKKILALIDVKNVITLHSR